MTLTRARNAAHEAFDQLWKTAHRVGIRRARGRAYRWLAREMRMRPADCHMSAFDKEQCKRVIWLCQTALYRHIYGREWRRRISPCGRHKARVA